MVYWIHQEILLSVFRHRVLIAIGWLSFLVGFAGIFLPGLPTTGFWIIAAFAFLRTNERMYRRILADKRFGPGIRLFVEERKITARGKAISMGAMWFGSSISIVVIPLVWLKVVIAAAVGLGSVLIWLIPTAQPEAHISHSDEGKGL